MHAAYFSLREVKRIHKQHGGYWFSRQTMRFFRSRVGKRVYHGQYFISSEQQEYNTPRRYTIRIVHGEHADIDTVGKFMEYASWQAARNAIERL